MSWILILIYLALQLAIGFWISRGIRNEDDYLVAGRSQPAWILSISLFATWFGAETCIGSSAAVFSQGLSGSRADPLGYSLCLLFSGLLIATKIWNRKFSTLGDFYRYRYGAVTEKFAAFILSISSLIWGAAQIRAFGQVVSATTSLNVSLALFLSCAFVVSYSLLGGLMGDIVTDVIQGIVLVFGLCLIILVIASEIDFRSILSSQTSVRLSLLSPGESVWERIDRWMVPVLGSLVTQEVIARILAAKTVRVARMACYVSCGIYLVVGSIPVILGLVGPEVIHFDGVPEQFLVELARQKLPVIIFIAFSGALISALLATIDSILLGVSALVAHNVLIPAFRIEDPKAKLKLNRVVVVVAGVISYVMAVYSNSIYDLLQISSSFGTAGILIISIIGLWFRLGCQMASMATLTVGLIFTPLAEYVLKLEAPFVTSIIICLAVYVGVSLVYSVRKKTTISSV